MCFHKNLFRTVIHNTKSYNNNLVSKEEEEKEVENYQSMNRYCYNWIGVVVFIQKQ